MPPWEEVGLIGHSIGGASCLHFLRHHVKEGRLGALALVCTAGKFRLAAEDRQRIQSFRFMMRGMSGLPVTKAVMINGLHDPYVPAKYALVLAKILRAKLVFTESGGHFGLTDPRNSTRELPAHAQGLILSAFGL